MMQGVTTQGIGFSDLGNTSSLDGPSSTSSIDWTSTSRAWYLLYNSTWEGKVGKEGFGFHLEHGLPSIHSSFKLLSSAW